MEIINTGNNMIDINYILQYYSSLYRIENITRNWVVVSYGFIDKYIVNHFNNMDEIIKIIFGLGNG